MKTAVLGPEGTFSHQAAIKNNNLSEIVFKNTIWHVFEAVEYDEVDEGIVPIENSLSGTVGFTIDALYEFDLNIMKELLIPINHMLASKGSRDSIKTLFLQSETHGQCQKFIRNHFPHANIIHTSSNGESAKNSSLDKSSGALTSLLASKIYKLKVLSKSVQDNKENVTKFISIGRKSTTTTKNDRTTITVNPERDKPGLLYDLLGIFYKRHINLTKIESIPVKGKFGQYFFLIEFQGHKDDANVKRAFSEVEKHFFLRVHGSYPRSY